MKIYKVMPLDPNDVKNLECFIGMGEKGE